MKVVLYTQPNCMPCRATVRKLNALHIPYEKVDVTQDAEALALVKSKGWQASPVVHVSGVRDFGDTWWSGYKPEYIDELAEALAESDTA